MIELFQAKGGFICAFSLIIGLSFLVPLLLTVKKKKGDERTRNRIVGVLYDARKYDKINGVHEMILCNQTKKLEWYTVGGFLFNQIYRSVKQCFKKSSCNSQPSQV